MDDTTKKYHSALSQCAELLPNMQDGDSIFDVPKLLAAALASQSQAAQPTDREAFEACHTKMDLQRNEDGSYTSGWTQIAWEGWQARAHLAGQSQATKVQAEPVVFEDFPKFNAQAMGCGLEDRGITDRYDAMRYGFEEALDLVDERIKNFLADFAAPVAKEAPAVLGGWEVVQEPGLIVLRKKGEGFSTFRDVSSDPREAILYRYFSDFLAAAPQAPATREAKDEQQANVLPPTRGTDSQRDALYRALINCGHSITDGVVKLYSNPKLPGNALSQLADRLEAELAARCRAEGGDTSKESSSDVATTTSTVSAPAEPYAYEHDNGTATELVYAEWFRRGGVMEDGDIYRPLFLDAPSSTDGAQKAPEEVRNQQQIEWSHDLQSRLMESAQQVDQDDAARNVMAEAACLLAELTGRTSSTSTDTGSAA